MLKSPVGVPCSGLLLFRSWFCRLVFVGLAAGAPVPLQGQLVRQANTTLNFPSALPSAGAYATQNALGSLTFSAPLCLRSLPGVSNRLFVVERNLGIQLVDLDTNTKSTFLDLAGYLAAEGTPLATDIENGFLGLAFHPDYNQNGYLYVFYSLVVGGQLHQRVARFQADGTPGSYNAATSVSTSSHMPLITQRDQAPNHNGGDLHFGGDGYLYISVGDEGASNDSLNNARFINKDFFSAILRIDVDQRPGSLAPNPHIQANSNAFPSAVHAGTYRIPPDNPFIGATSHHGVAISPDSVRTEIYATGLRNPWRFSFDPPTGRLFVGDVGQDGMSWEEIDLVSPGDDLGWSYREGSHPFTSGPGGATPPAAFNPVEPIYDYPRGTGPVEFRGLSVTGGFIYRGTRLTELSGDYIFADWGSGRIWSLREIGGTWNVSLIYSELGFQITAFAPDPRNGDVLYCMIGNGQVRRLIRSVVGAPLPATLSATGAFSDLATLTPQAGIVPYAPNLPFWSDHAIKTRWVSIPNLADQMTWSRDENWSFPAGQIWVKHFDIEMERGNPASRRRLETRFLVKNASGAYGVTYKWRSDESDADLVGAEGLSETLAVTENGAPVAQTWRYPSHAECMSCHTAAAGFALSMTTRQMNRDFTYGAQTANQIQALSDAGYFVVPPGQVHNLPALASLTDTSKSLEWRVRSYLAANCSQCHRPGGGGQGNWDARDFLTTAATGILDGAVGNDGGDPDYRYAKPGDPGHSMLLTRIQGANGFARMPPLGSNVLDAQAIALLTEWVTTELAARQDFGQWQLAHFGSTTSPPAQPDADPDGDGQSNRMEFLTYADPLAAAASWRLIVDRTETGLEVTFPRLPNRSILLETSIDLETWTPWDVPGNAPEYSSGAAPKTVSEMFAPGEGAARQFFRARIEDL